MLAKMILSVCVLGSVWGYLEEDNWTNYQSLGSYQSPTSRTWPWQGVKKGILGRQGILSNLSPAQLAFLALVSSLSLTSKTEVLQTPSAIEVNLGQGVKK